MSFGHDVSGFVLSHLDSYTAQVYQDLIGAWPALTLTTLYIIIAGYKIMSGNAGKHAKDLFVSIVLLMVIQSVIQSGFSEWVAKPVITTAQGLGQLAIDASGTSNGDVFQRLDDGLGQIMTTVDRIEPTGNIFTQAWLYIKVTFASALMALAFVAVYVIYLVLYLMAFFSIYMMLMVGGISLFLAAFRETRQYTLAWVRALANYILWIFFMSAVVGFFMDVIFSYVGDLAKNWDLAVNGPFPPSLGKMIFFCILVCYLLLKSSDWSSTITGGLSMSPGIITSGAGIVGNALGSAARSAPARAAGAFGVGLAGAAGGAAWRGAAGGVVRAYSAMRGVK